MSIDIATWNVNSLRARFGCVERWLTEASPDVACLQEIKVVDELFPAEKLSALGYEHQAVWGQKTYNGVAILSKLPITDVHRGFRANEDDEQSRLIQGTVAGIRIFNCYVPNGNKVGSAKFKYKLRWYGRLKRELAATVKPTDAVCVLGDFNVAFDDLDAWDPFEAEGNILFSADERAALAKITRFGLRDSYREKHPLSMAFSWWDYRAGGWPRNHGFRIDHVLLSDSLMERCSDVRIDKHTRGWEAPSDHAPVVATIEDA